MKVVALLWHLKMAQWLINFQGFITGEEFLVVQCWNLMSVCWIEWGEAEGPSRRECLLQPVIACSDLFGKVEIGSFQ